MKWQLKVPKEIRANAVKEVVSNYKTAFSLLKNKKIKYFKMKYRKKKKDHKYLILSKSGSHQSMPILLAMKYRKRI